MLCNFLALGVVEIPALLNNCSFEAFGLEEVDDSVEDDVLVAAVFLLLEEASERKISDQHIHVCDSHSA